MSHAFSRSVRGIALATGAIALASLAGCHKANMAHNNRGMEMKHMHEAKGAMRGMLGHMAMMNGSGRSLRVRDISLQQAMHATMAAVRQAGAMGIKEDVAVVGRGGRLKFFVRMNGAWLGSIDIAIKKAKTARFFKMPTGAIGKLAQPGGPLYGIGVSNHGLITFPGGALLKDGSGKIIGAIGASGSSVGNDAKCANAGARALHEGHTR